MKNFSSCRESSVRLSTWNNNHLIINDSQLKVDSRNLHLELQNRLTRPQNWGQQLKVEEIDLHFHKTRAWLHFVIVIKSIVYVSHICFAHVFLWGKAGCKSLSCWMTVDYKSASCSCFAKFTGTTRFEYPIRQAPNQDAKFGRAVKNIIPNSPCDNVVQIGFYRWTTSYHREMCVTFLFCRYGWIIQGKIIIQEVGVFNVLSVNLLWMPTSISTSLYALASRFAICFQPATNDVKNQELPKI